jgi:hypothetical protein
MRVFRAAMAIAFLVACLVASLGGSGYAQQAPMPKYGDEPKEKSPQEKEADKAAERAYQRSLGNIPDHGPTDPWGTVRSNNDAPKASVDKTSVDKTSAAKAKKTKTGSVN